MDLLPTKEASRLLEKAWSLDQKALLKAKNKKEANLLWKESVSICRNLLKEFPREINLLLKIATIYQHQGKFEKVRYYLYKANKHYPNNFLVQHNLGNLYRAKGKNKLALRYYKSAVKLSGDNELMKKSLENFKKSLTRQ